MPSTATTVPIPILLLEEESDPLPRWMSYYRQVSYILHGIHIVYSWAYLCFVGYIQHQKVLHIQYEPVNKFLTYNSYSVLSPLLCCLFVSILIYHIKKRVKLDEGDFFGLLGVLLLLCLVLCYDGVGIYHLYSDRVDYLSSTRNRWVEAINDEKPETNELAWQYAWSTKPSCARVHAKRLRKKIELDSETKEDSKEGKPGPLMLKPNDAGEIFPWMYSGLTQTQLEKGFLKATFRQSVSDPACDGIVVENTVDEQRYKNECGCSPNSKEKQEHREWMEIMQKKFECCGPRGREDWKNRIKDMDKCQSKTKQFKDGCAKPFSEYLRSLFGACIIMMLLETFFYILTIILACFHFAAMKYDETRVAKEYSLLDLTADPAKKVIAISKDQDQGDTKIKAIAHDPVQNLFQQANLRVARGRRSTAELHFPIALTMNKDPRNLHGARRLSIMSHAVQAFGGHSGSSHIHAHTSKHKP